MFIPNASVTGRIRETFIILKKTFLAVFAPLFFYNISFLLLKGLLFLFGIYFFNQNKDLINSDIDLNTIFSIQNIIFMLAYGFIWLLLICLYVPVFIFIVKNISDFIKGKLHLSIKENITKGFEDFFPIMGTYYHIFMYLFFIPAITFISGGFIFVLSSIYNFGTIFNTIGEVLMGLSVLLIVTFSAIRGLRIVFSLYSAIDKEDYSKNNFDFSVNLTKGNWWRIIGNLVFLSLTIGILFGIIKSVFGTLLFFSTNHTITDMLKDLLVNIQNFSNISNMGQSITNKEGLDVQSIMKNFSDSFSLVGYIGGKLSNMVFDTLYKSFSFIFMFLFYKRLEAEKNLEK